LLGLRGDINTSVYNNHMVITNHTREFSFLHLTQYAHHIQQFLQYTVTVNETYINHTKASIHGSIPLLTQKRNSNGTISKEDYSKFIS